MCAREREREREREFVCQKTASCGGRVREACSRGDEDRWGGEGAERKGRGSEDGREEGDGEGGEGGRVEGGVGWRAQAAEEEGVDGRVVTGREKERKAA